MITKPVVQSILYTTGYRWSFTKNTHTTTARVNTRVVFSHTRVPCPFIHTKAITKYWLAIGRSILNSNYKISGQQEFRMWQQWYNFLILYGCGIMSLQSFRWSFVYKINIIYYCYFIVFYICTINELVRVGSA